jgi:hypothetical protein
MKTQAFGITNNQWSLDQLISGKRCLCFTSNYIMKIHASLNKQMFFPNEKVIVNIQIDNSRNKRDIKDIQCTLTHNVIIRKADKTL